MAEEHWSELEETTKSAWKFKFMLWAATHLPRRLVEAIAAIIVFFFYLGAAPIRKRSKRYLNRVFALQKKEIPRFAVYRHFLAYALSMIEKIRSWAGKMSLSELETQQDDLNELVSQIDSGKGAFVICSHLGNMEALRGLTGFRKNHSKKNFQVFPVINFSVTKNFNALLENLNPDWKGNCFDADSIGVETAVQMREKINDGDLIAIAGDRTSAHARNRFVSISFLGELAEFPEGAFALARILKAPIYFIFAFRKKDLDITSPYEFHVIRSRTLLTKKSGVAELVSEFASYLERFCLKHPYQWYNFYDFWKKEN